MRILDSDHCVAILRGQLDPREWVPPNEELAVTAISVGELMHGAFKSAQPNENLARLSVLLSKVTILPYEATAARQFGRIKAELERGWQDVERPRSADCQYGACVWVSAHHTQWAAL
jgi:tRNA(fMet)-specific endonuclease VapC